jgi:hypothetical protein
MVSRTLRRLVAVQLVLLLLCIATGCATTRASSDVVGRWEHRGPGSIVTRVELKRDGTLKGTDVPDPIILGTSGGEPVWSRLYGFTGTWKLDGDRIDIDVSTETFEGLTIESGPSTALMVTGNGSSTQIYDSIGDPDNMNRFVLTRSR